MINLLTQKGVYVELYSTISILGYSLLPFCCLAVGSLFLELRNPIGIGFCLFIISWSTVTATRFFENSLDMRD
jgi:protein YIPF5/7